MATIESVLSPALANAALLIAAPSLGCLNTYTIALTDLLGAYNLPAPDLTPILRYSPSSITSVKDVDLTPLLRYTPSSITSVKDVGFRELDQGTTSLQVDSYDMGEVEIKLENIKEEPTEEYRDMNVQQRMSQEQNTKVTMHEPSLTNVSKPILIAAKNTSGNSKRLNLNHSHESIPKKPHFPSVHHGKSLIQTNETKTLMVVTMKSDGKIQYFTSRKDLYSWKTARDNMPVIHVHETEKPTSSVMYVITYREDPSRSFLKSQYFNIPISNIHNIISRKDDSFVIHYNSSKNKDYTTLVLQTKATKPLNGRQRSAIENKAAIIRWLQTILG